MQNKLSDCLISISTLMLLAKDREEMIRLSGKMNEAVLQAMTLERTKNCLLPDNKKTLSATILFTEDELNKLPTAFRKYFNSIGRVADAYKYDCGEGKCEYEIIFDRNGYFINVKNEDLATAKKMFLESACTLYAEKEDCTENRLSFTEKEIMKMPKTVRKFFRLNGRTIHFRKRTNGRYNCSYEIRYAKKPYDKHPITASGTTLEEAKGKFIEKLNEYEMRQQGAPAVPTDFYAFAKFWFENFHKRKVCEETYNKSFRRYEKYVKPIFGNMKVKDIYSTLIQNLLDTISDRHRLEEDVHSMLNQIFSCAVKHGIININPVGMVFHKNAEREHGVAINKSNEKKLLNAYENTDTQIVCAVMLYTGLRPCEYSSAIVEEKFIKARNRKRKGGKIEYKRIPISPMLRPYVKNLTALPPMNMKTLDRRIKKILPQHKPYDMRTTFETRCDGCGIEERAIGLFMGNDIGKDKNDAKLKKAYTDINDPDYLEYLYQEGQKLNY